LPETVICPPERSSLSPLAPPVAIWPLTPTLVSPHSSIVPPTVPEAWTLEVACTTAARRMTVPVPVRPVASASIGAGTVIVSCASTDTSPPHEPPLTSMSSSVTLPARALALNEPPQPSKLAPGI